MSSEASLRPMLAVTTTDVPKPAEMPVQRQKEGKRVFNLRTAEAIGFKIPAKLLEGAETFK